MLKLSICAETVYRHENFEGRIGKISENGMDTIEFWQWHDKNLKEIHDVLKQNHVNLLGFCVDSRNPKISEAISKTALNTDTADVLLKAVSESIETAKYFGTKNLIITVGDNIGGLSYERQIKNVVRNLNLIKGYFEKEKITLLVEPINLSERSSYLIPNVKTLIPIIEEVSSEYVKILYDIYHQGMESDFSTEGLKNTLPYVGHIHAADCPERGEPGTGNINYADVFDMLGKEKYDKYIGLECLPKKPEEEIFKELFTLCKLQK